MDYIVFINLISTLLLTGLIWTIQLVHYPSFKYVSEEKFSVFMEFHMKNITYLVGPLMLIEIIVSANLFSLAIDKLIIINLLIVTLIWLSTLFLSIPCHNKLKDGYQLQTIKKLTLTNWPRTILWSLKSYVSVLVLLKFS